MATLGAAGPTEAHGTRQPAAFTDLAVQSFLPLPHARVKQQFPDASGRSGQVSGSAMALSCLVKHTLSAGKL